MGWRSSSGTYRGYGGTAWLKLRERVLAEAKYICQCENCRNADRISVATEVDHIVGKSEWLRKYGNLDGVDDRSNLQAINKDCHKLKTMLEAGHRPRTVFDANGHPTSPDHHWNKK